MKRILTGLLCCALMLPLGACSSPDALKLDLYQGYNRELHLVHWNAGNAENTEKINFLAQTFEGAVALEKDISQFAYYPDYRLVITGKSLEITTGADGVTQEIHVVDDAAGTICAVVDLNQNRYVDFYLPESDSPETLYRSPYHPDDWLLAIHS